MSTEYRYGLEQARARLPHIVSDVAGGSYSVITRHGKPCAAVVSIADLERLQSSRPPGPSVLALRASGRGLWGPDIGETLGSLRAEWERR
jgi:prevent-host-death family protein